MGGGVTLQEYLEVEAKVRADNHIAAVQTSHKGGVNWLTAIIDGREVLLKEVGDYDAYLASKEIKQLEMVF